METVKKNDFVELKFTGFSDGKPFDSNIEEDLKKIQPDAKPNKTIVIVGQGMVVSGLDKNLEGKEIGIDCEVKVSAKEGFGERDRNMVKTIPLKSFTEKQVNPKPGMVLALDNYIVKIITISGARVVVDFNNPLAGRELVYKYKIVRRLEDMKEKAEFLLRYYLRFKPEFEVKEDHILVKGPKELEVFVHGFKDKFKELVGKDLKFELKEVKPEEKKEEAKSEVKAEETKVEEKIEKSS